MSDEDEQDQQVQEQPEEDWKAKFEALQAQSEEAQSEVKRLVSENKKYRERAQNAEFSHLKAQYPQLEPEDIAGLNPEQVEKLLSKVTAKPDTEEEQAGVTPEVKQATEAFTATAGGSAPPMAERISFAKAKEMGGPSNPEVRALIEKGLVEGVTLPT